MLLKRVVKRQYQNIRFLKAYSLGFFLKELIRFPVDFYLKRGKSSYPSNIAIHLSNTCNLDCKMCAVSDAFAGKNRFIPFSLFSKIIDDVSQYKPFIILYGGEPLLHPDFIRIVEYLQKTKLNFGIFTNGIPITEKEIKILMAMEPRYISFSLLGPGDIHDSIARVSGSYDKLVRNIELFLRYRRNTTLVVHSVITNENINHIDKLPDAVSDLKLDGLRLGHLVFLTSDEKEKSTYLLKQMFNDDIVSTSYVYDITNGEKEKFSAILREFSEKHKDIGFTPELSFAEIQNWYSTKFHSRRKCLFIWRGTFITIDGDVIPCAGSFNLKMGNALTERFSDIWNNKKYVDFRRRINERLPVFCSRCCRL